MQELSFVFILLGIVLSVFSPWTKTGGLLSLLSLVYYLNQASITNWLPIILLIGGLVLIILEILIPGFGLLGIAGTILLYYGFYSINQSIQETIFNLSISFITSVVLIFLLIQTGNLTKRWERIILNTKSPISSPVKDKQAFPLEVGDIGITTTPLRPSGKVKFDVDDTIYDVLSISEHIQSKQEVQIKRIEGNKIIVQKI